MLATTRMSACACQLTKFPLLYNLQDNLSFHLSDLFLAPFQEAELAKEKTHGYKLDRLHIFSVNMFDDFDRFMRVPDEWAPPETTPYTPGVII